MRRRIEQHLVLVLTVEVHEAAAQLAKRRARRERAVDQRAAAPLRGHLAADDDFLAVRGLEDRFDRRGVLSGADEIGRGAAPHEQPDGADDDRLPRPGFPGQNVQARLELELEAVDDGKVTNGQEAQHV